VVLQSSDVQRRLSGAAVVLVGEHHGTPEHHALQQRVALSLARQRGSSRVVAAIEWLPRSARLALRGWLAGSEDATALSEAVAWQGVWGHDFDAYRPFFEALRAAGIAIEPVNAEPGLARAVARGIELDATQKALLPPLDSGDDAHRAWFAEQMRAMHGHHGAHHGAAAPDGAEAQARMARLYRAQLVWDETMARNIVSLLNEGFEQVVACAGMGHTTRGLGIAARLGSHAWLVVHPVMSLDDAMVRVADRPYPEREADLFWVPSAMQPTTR
jgi:uncharacterized iron-regulated protein